MLIQISLPLMMAAGLGLSVAVAEAQPVPCSAEGTVRDALGDPLPGVIVALRTTGLNVVTDEQGRYCLPRLRADRYVLEFSLAGFRPEARTVEILAGRAATADVTLELGGFREETVVTATRTRQGLDRVPVRTEVIRRADIEASSAGALPTPWSSQRASASRTTARTATSPRSGCSASTARTRRSSSTASRRSRRSPLCTASSRSPPGSSIASRW
jgi:hypothetical protein